MKFCPAHREDISRYYRHTYIKLQEFGDQLFFIEQVEANRIIGTHESGEKFCIYMSDDTPYEMEYMLPHKSFFQYGDKAVQLCRVPAKQYLRGLAPSNTQVLYIGTDGKPKQIELDFPLLKAYVQKAEWPKLSAAVEMADKSSVAMNSRMMYMRGNKHLYIDFVPVAFVNINQKRLEVKKPIFTDEVKDLLKSTGEDGVWSVIPWVAPTKKKEDVEKMKQDDLKKALLAKHPVKVAMAEAVPHPMWNVYDGGEVA